MFARVRPWEVSIRSLWCEMNGFPVVFMSPTGIWLREADGTMTNLAGEGRPGGVHSALKPNLDGEVPDTPRPPRQPKDD